MKSPRLTCLYRLAMMAVLLLFSAGCGRIVKGAVGLPFKVAEVAAVESVKLPIRTARLAADTTVGLTARTVQHALK